MEFYLWTLIVIYQLPSVFSKFNSQQQVTIEIVENLTIGTKIVDLKTKINSNADVKFRISSNNYFTIKDKTVMYTKNLIDRDKDRNLCKNPEYPKLCQWSGFLISKNEKVYNLRIIIQDINDNKPSWPNIKFIHLQIPENSQAGYKLEFPLAKDVDYGINSIQYYSLEPRNSAFFISNAGQTSNIPLLILKKDQKLDREIKAWHNLTLIAHDGGIELKLSGTIPLIVEILDENDNQPMFDSSFYSIKIDEDTQPNQIIPLSIKAYDLDKGEFGTLQFKFAISTPPYIKYLFKVDKYTGKLSLIRSLKQIMNKRRYYNFVLIATDGGLPPKSGKTKVRIEISDKNTYAPLITVRSMPDPTIKSISVTEELNTVNYLIASISVMDDDNDDKNSQFNCSLTDKSDSFKLEFSKKLGKIKIFSLKTLRVFDREKKKLYSINIICNDFGVPSLTSDHQILVDVVDVNDHSPIFQKPETRIRITEGNEPNNFVYEIRAYDQDSGPNSQLRYEIICLNTNIPSYNRSDLTKYSKCPFKINSSGRITSSEILDREANPEGFNLKITAYDHGSPPRNSSTKLIIDLEDFNDCKPEFSKKVYHLQVKEDFGSLFRQKLIGTVKATDMDLNKNSEIFYRIINARAVPFEIEPRTGKILTNRLIDRERTESPTISFVVSAVDNPANLLLRMTSTTTVKVSIIDVNDHSPIFVTPNKTDSTISLSCRAKKGYMIIKVVARDKDSGENGKINYYLTKGNSQGLFDMEIESGVLRVKKNLHSVNKGRYPITIKATDKSQIKPLMDVIHLILIIDDSEPQYRADQPSDFDKSGSSYQANHNQGLNSNGESNIALAGRKGWWEPNKLIICSILLMTGVVSCVLIAAICVMARRRNAEIEKRNRSSIRPAVACRRLSHSYSNSTSHRYSTTRYNSCDDDNTNFMQTCDSDDVRKNSILSIPTTLTNITAPITITTSTQPSLDHCKLITTPVSFATLLQQQQQQQLSSQPLSQQNNNTIPLFLTAPTSLSTNYNPKNNDSLRHSSMINNYHLNDLISSATMLNVNSHGSITTAPVLNFEIQPSKLSNFNMTSNLNHTNATNPTSIQYDSMSSCYNTLNSNPNVIT